MSDCITACCLAHRHRVFLQGWGPDAGKWCHGDAWPCNPALVEAWLYGGRCAGSVFVSPDDPPREIQAVAPLPPMFPPPADPDNYAAALGVETYWLRRRGNDLLYVLAGSEP